MSTVVSWVTHREFRPMGRKAHPSITTSVVVLVFLVIIVGLVESTPSSSSGRLKLRALDLLRPETAQRQPPSAASGDGPNIIYEDGIVIETVLDENHLGLSIYSTLAVPFKAFLYAVDSTASQLLKVRLPIDQSSGAEVARRIAGDGKGRTGYNDGWGKDALLDHPKALTIDGDGNVYVADVRNRVIRKISPGGYVTTLAGQPNKTGHVDGEGRNALFSSDFTLTYLPGTCSLLISDRGNRRLRMIQLKNPLKCDYEGAASDHVWKSVSYVFGGLLTILAAALAITLYQKAELQHSVLASLALDDDDESPLNQHHNGGAGHFPYLIPRPRLSDSATNLRRGRSLPDDISDHKFYRTDLMDFSDSPSYAGESNRSKHFLEDSASNSSGDAENDPFQGMSSPRREGAGASILDRLQFHSNEHHLRSTPESTLTRPLHSFPSDVLNTAALVAPDRRLSIDEEWFKNLAEFTQNHGS